MKLIIATEKDYLLSVDTDKQNTESRFFNGVTKDAKTSALAINGNNLICSLNYNSSYSKSSLLIINLFNGKYKIFDCPRSLDIQTVVPIYSGRIYVSSSSEDCLCGISYNEDGIESDEIHYAMNGVNNLNSEKYITCVHNFKGRWFASVLGSGWRIGDYSNGEIIEYSNQRTVFSNTIKANSIYFDSFDRICFCEQGKIILGNKQICLDGLFRGIVEDKYKKGYWTGLVKQNNSFLLFINYYGQITEQRLLGKDIKIHSIVGIDKNCQGI